MQMSNTSFYQRLSDKYTMKWADEADDIEVLYKAYQEAVSSLTLHKDSPVKKENAVNTIRQFLLRDWNNRCLILVYANDDPNTVVGLIAGIVSINPLLPEDKIATEMLYWVAKPHRRSRLGIQLIHKFEEWAEAVGCTHTTLAYYVDADEISLNSLYRHCGYTQLETTYLKRIN